MNETSGAPHKALDDAVKKCCGTVNRAMLSLLGLALFCVLTILGAADRSLVEPAATIKVPFVETHVSFVGFLVVAPLLLVSFAIYLHVFYGYWLDLDARRRAEGLAETYPTLFTIDRRVARLLTALILYWIVPVVLATITWKASARLEWALPCAVVTGLVTTALAVLRATRRAGSKWRYKQLVLPGLLYVLMIIAPLLLGIRALESPAIRHRLERPVNLFRADLKDAWLVEARLHRAQLGLANLQRANLSGVDLREANLSGADLNRANLFRADLRGADLRGAHLTAAHLGGAWLSKADLSGKNLSGANLSWAELSWANLKGTDFTGAHLSGAWLGEADLSGADLRGADLTEARLFRANLIKADLRRADLRGAKLFRADLRKADLREANLSGADLRKADLSGADLSGADLSRANLIKADLRGTDLSGVDLSGADLQEAKGVTSDQVRASFKLQ